MQILTQPLDNLRYLPTNFSLSLIHFNFSLFKEINFIIIYSLCPIFVCHQPFTSANELIWKRKQGQILQHLWFWCHKQFNFFIAFSTVTFYEFMKFWGFVVEGVFGFLLNNTSALCVELCCNGAVQLKEAASFVCVFVTPGWWWFQTGNRPGDQNSKPQRQQINLTHIVWIFFFPPAACAVWLKSSSLVSDLWISAYVSNK